MSLPNNRSWKQCAAACASVREREQEVQVLGSGKVLLCSFGQGEEIQRSNSPVNRAYLILLETSQILALAELLFFFQNC